MPPLFRQFRQIYSNFPNAPRGSRRNGARPQELTLSSADEIELESFYDYRYRGRDMIAVRAPFATTGDAPDLVGRIASIGGVRYHILAISRQIGGPIAKGEPIGIAVRPADGDGPRNATAC
jgi:hypothetical protein